MPEQQQSPEPVEPDTARQDGATPTVFEAVAHATRIVRAVGKWGNNASQNYKFRAIDDLMTAANEAFGKAGVVIAPKVLQRLVDDSHKTGSNNVMRWVDLEVRYRLYGPAGDHFDVVMWGEARDAADKATSKALSAAYKYFLMETLCIPTVDLPDADNEHPVAQAPEPVRQQARAERRQTERSQQGQEAPQPGRQAPRGLSPEELHDRLVSALQGATTKTDLGKRLAAIPGGLVVETAPGKFRYDSARLRDLDVCLDKKAGDVVTAWEAVVLFGQNLPDEIHDPEVPEPGETGGRYPSEADIPQPPASSHGPAQRLHPGDPDPEGSLWEQEDAEREAGK